MNHLLRGVVRAVSETFALPGPILEVGSYQVEGQDDLINLRALFPGQEYVGLDMRAGPGVDQVGSVESLPFPDATFGTVLALSTFEHVRCFWKGFAEVHRVLRPDGCLLVACPFFFRIHNFPEDYWRFTPAALEVLLEKYPHKIVGWHGARHRPANVWAMACREKCPPISPEAYARYQSLMKQYARQPRSWRRLALLRLAGLVLGRGHFANYVDCNHWETICRTTSPTFIPTVNRLLPKSAQVDLIQSP